MIEIRWTSKALSDLARLNAFLAPLNPHAAATAVRQLVAAPTRLLEQPRLGERVAGFEPRDVRRILVGRYELRYELTADTLYIVRIWHTREQR